MKPFACIIVRDGTNDRAILPLDLVRKARTHLTRNHGSTQAEFKHETGLSCVVERSYDGVWLTAGFDETTLHFASDGEFLQATEYTTFALSEVA
jgi:hypothetical protein